MRVIGALEGPDVVVVGRKCFRKGVNLRQAAFDEECRERDCIKYDHHERDEARSYWTVQAR